MQAKGTIVGLVRGKVFGCIKDSFCHRFFCLFIFVDIRTKM